MGGADDGGMAGRELLMALDKLVDSTQLDGAMTETANALRTKGGTSAQIAWDNTYGFKAAVEALPSGGGGGAVEEKDVNFIDYDGTLVASKTKAEINAMTADTDLPENPTHTGLTAQGWNWTVAQLKTQLTAMPNQKVYVGQMYTTSSGATEIDVEMQDGRLSPIMTIAVKGTVSIDWGDGTTPDTVTGTSLTTRNEQAHTYANAGRYTINVLETTGSEYSFYCSSTYLLLRKNTTGNENRVYTNCVKAIRIGNGIKSIANYAFYCCGSLASITLPSGVTSIGNSAFYNCYSIASITLPSGITSIVSSAFNYCYSLASIAIPSGVTSIEGNAFSNCTRLASIAIPSGVTSIGSSAFYNCYSLASITLPSDIASIGLNTFYYCYSLASITLPSGVTSIGNYAFYYCYSLASITLPSGVTSIGDNTFGNCLSLASITIPSRVTSIGKSAFGYCYGVKEYHIVPTTIPTAGTTIFNSIVSDCVIYVPSAKLNDYKTASNWSTYASYMQGE